MKTVLIRSWWIYGLCSVVFLGLCPEIGWYALANAAVVLTGVYLSVQAWRREKRLRTSQDVIAAMTPKQRRSLEALDERERKSIQALRRMMVWLCLGVLFLNGYTWIYNMSRHRAAALVSGPVLEQLSPAFLGLGLVSGLLYYVAWNGRMEQMLIELPAGRPAVRSLLDSKAVRRRKASTGRSN